VKRALLCLVLGAALSAPANGQDAVPWSVEEIRQVGLHGPWPPAPPLDPTNRVSGNQEAIALGHHLFNDARLSADARFSCATCHVAGRDWTDGRARGFGIVELDRRTPSLWNVGYQHWFGWDGAADSLWMQSLRPILEPREMGNSAAAAARLVRHDAALACGYERVFGEAPGGDDEKVLVDIAKALAAFQATLVTPRTSFDAFRDALVAGDLPGAASFPQDAQRGLKLFIGRAGCNNCHLGPLFSSGEFGDVGIPFFLKTGEVDSGRFGGIGRLRQSPFNRLGKYNDDGSPASALRTRHVERQHRNYGEFRVPGLRQIGRDGPYMHDGSIATLEEVVKHYSEVSPDRLHSDGLPLVRPLGLSPAQSADLVAFLRTLDSEPSPPAAPPPLCR
jgi:cytochrome c peroxidase